MHLPPIPSRHHVAARVMGATATTYLTINRALEVMHKASARVNNGLWNLNAGILRCWRCDGYGEEGVGEWTMPFHHEHAPCSSCHGDGRCWAGKQLEVALYGAFNVVTNTLVRARLPLNRLGCFVAGAIDRREDATIEFTIGDAEFTIRVPMLELEVDHEA